MAGDPIIQVVDLRKVLGSTVVLDALSLDVHAGEAAQRSYGEWLPEDTIEAIRYFLVALKGPLTTPVGGGFRSLNVALRQILDLFACVRPVRWFRGVPSPVREPEKMNVVIFRENTEDVYAGIEWQAGSAEANRGGGAMASCETSQPTKSWAYAAWGSASRANPPSGTCSKRSGSPESSAPSRTR